MCTAITYKTRDTYFGRTLDVECSYGEQVAVMPRRAKVSLAEGRGLDEHYAIIGMAHVSSGVPLYFDAANEHGLCMAALNFPRYARYFPRTEERENIPPFELILRILSLCRDIREARELLKRASIWDICFSDELPSTPLHWMIADKSGGSIVVESVSDGLKIYDDPVGVLTNSPPFDYHMNRLCDYLNLVSHPPKSDFAGVPLEPYSMGMGAVGLPGDLSSSSRFVRASFTRLCSVSGDGEEQSISQFFHILGSVEQIRGCVYLPDGRAELTAYTSCINACRGVYYYKTYENSRICAIDMHTCDLDCSELYLFPLEREQSIYYHNR